VRRGTPLLVVGDALLDRDIEGRAERLCPDAPVPVVDELREESRPGGAALAAALAAADGRGVTLVTALADDEPGRELAGLLLQSGVRVLDLGLDGPTPQKVRIRGSGQPLLRLDHGPTTPGAVGECTDAVREAVERAAAVLVSDYGRGVAAQPGLRSLLAKMSPRTPVVWDPHPCGSEPVPGVRLATPNRSEAAAAAPDAPGAAGDGVAEATAMARALAARWRAVAVVVTRGTDGAVLVNGDGPPLVVPAPAVERGDPCGSGDRFASAAAGLLADGALPSEAVVGAVGSASAFVAAGGAAGFRLPHPEEPAREQAADVVSRVRAKGGTVVATGGCFDLLHAGHVSTLESARALGDCLVVLLNSDASVRRLKGPDRPLVAQGDRGAVLAALACVDAVVVFDEDTPETALERLRPDIFAKGGDYAVGNLPETATMARWGGQVVILPYVEGRSTTNLLSLAGRSSSRLG
jgi:D-beta-D-heptose 7-phosphate kinase/D-beta-D-heptose 1-phosphate adenosyltransferase